MSYPRPVTSGIVSDNARLRDRSTLPQLTAHAAGAISVAGTVSAHSSAREYGKSAGKEPISAAFVQWPLTFSRKYVARQRIPGIDREAPPSRRCRRQAKLDRSLARVEQILRPGRTAFRSTVRTAKSANELTVNTVAKIRYAASRRARGGRAQRTYNMAAIKNPTKRALLQRCTSSANQKIWLRTAIGTRGSARLGFGWFSRQDERRDRLGFRRKRS